MKKIDGKISIYRVYSTDFNRDSKIIIEISDTNHMLMTVVEMKPDDFAKAITGLSCIDCDLEIWDSEE